MRFASRDLVCALTVVLALSAWTVNGQTIIADLRTDYDAGAAGFMNGTTSAGKISDTAATGSWNFYRSDTVDPTNVSAALTLLTYSTTANSVRAANAYVTPGASFDLPAWSNDVLITPGFNDGIPASNELEVHPGEFKFAVAGWTSGFSGTIRVAGGFHDIGTQGDGVTFAIYHNGVSVFSTSLTDGSLATFDQTFAVVATDKVYFVVGSGPFNDFGGDSSALSATISAIPEPSTYAVCAGLGVLGFVGLRRRTISALRG